MGSTQSSDLSAPDFEHVQSALSAIGGGVRTLQEVLGPAAERWGRAEVEAEQWRVEVEQRLVQEREVAEQRLRQWEDRLKVAVESVEETDGRWRDLQQRQACFEERLTRVEERLQSVEGLQGDLAPVGLERETSRRSLKEGCASSRDPEARVQFIERRILALESSLQRALDTMFPRVDSLLVQLGTPERTECVSPCASPVPPPPPILLSPSETTATTSLDPLLRGPPGPDFPPPPPYEELDSLLLSPAALLAAAATSPALPSTASSASASATTASVGSGSSTRRSAPPAIAACAATASIIGGGNNPGTSAGVENSADLSASLLQAAREVSSAEVRALLACGAEVNTCDAQGRSPLHWAATYGRASNVSVLLHAGADVNARSSRSIRGFTPMHEAALRGHAECARLLAVAGADLESGDDAGWTPLHLAAIRGHEAAARALLAHGALPSARNVWGKRPRDVARVPALRRLLAR